MLPSRRREDDVCPVPEEFLSALYRAHDQEMCELVATVAPDIKVLLAIYCYQRSHLHTRGLTIAASCDRDGLVRSGGHVGAFLYARSREAPLPPPTSTFNTRRTITLATGPLRQILPFDEGSDDVDIRID
jgi:hypothetical protein